MTGMNSLIYSVLCLDDFFEAMRSGSPRDPKSIKMDVEREFMGMESLKVYAQDGETRLLGGYDDIVAVQVVPTLLKLVAVKDYASYEYEFEGWLLGDYLERIWVCGSLHTNGGESGKILESSISRLGKNEHHVGLRPLFPIGDPDDFVYPPV